MHNDHISVSMQIIELKALQACISRATQRIAAVVLSAHAPLVQNDTRNIWTGSADAKSNPISIKVN